MPLRFTPFSPSLKTRLKLCTRLDCSTGNPFPAFWQGHGKADANKGLRACKKKNRAANDISVPAVIFVRLGPVPYKWCGTERGSSKKKTSCAKTRQQTDIRRAGSTQRTPRMADDAPAGDGAGARDSTMQL